jgi:transposase-like protein
MRPYSEDLRERAVQRAEAGETIREIAAALRISPSCVSKWRKRQRETGSLAPDQMGGHKPRTLVGEHAEWLRARQDQHGTTARVGPSRATAGCARAAWLLEDADLHRRPEARPRRCPLRDRRTDQRRPVHRLCRAGAGADAGSGRHRHPRQPRQPQGTARSPCHPPGRRTPAVSAALQPGPEPGPGHCPGRSSLPSSST